MSGPFGSHQWMYASGGFYGFDIESSLRFNDDDSAYLTFTPASAGNRRTFTFSAWVKRGNIGTSQALFGTGSSSTNYSEIYFTSDKINLFNTNSGTNAQLVSTSLFRDPSAWYHFVFEVDTTQVKASNRIKIYVNGEAITSFSTETYPAQNYDFHFNNSVQHSIGSLYYTAGNIEFLDGYMAEVNFIDGTALDPTSFGETKEGIWIPKDTSGLTFGTNGFRLQFKDDAEVQGFNTVLYRGNGGTQSVTGMGFQPDLIWHKDRNFDRNHSLVDSVRGTNDLQSNSTAAERSIPSFVSFDSDGFTVTQNGSTNPNWNESGATKVAWGWDAGANNTPTGHSSVTYTGNGGTQKISGFGFRPDLVWIKNRSNAYNHRLYDKIRGNSRALQSNQTNAESTYGAMSFESDGFSFTNDSQQSHNTNGDNYVAWGWKAGDSNVSNTDGSITSTVRANTDYGFSIVKWSGNQTSGATVGHGLGASPSLIITKCTSHATSWVVGLGGLSGFGVNDYLTLQTTGAKNSSSTFYQAYGTDTFTVGVSSADEMNKTGRDYISYVWAEVSGYSKFGSYTGNGSTSGPTITTGFRPGWLMIKNADSGGDSDHWSIVDGSRSPFAPQHDWLFANGSFEESTNETNRSVTFTDTGFTINSTTQYINNSGDTFIYMAFAGSYSDYITDVNTTGTITSRVKANPTYGFSVVSYVGSGANATVGHGLDNAPEMIIARSRDSVSNWGVYHSSLTATDIIYLNLTNASGASSTQWNDTEPTSSVFSLGSGGQNKSGEDHIAYCWSAVSGYSSFGSFTGNGSSTGPTVTTNFAPALIILKRTDTTGNWILIDNTRTTDTSGNDNTLFPNLSDVEATGDNRVQFTSTGFQLVTTAGNYNASGGTYIYMAFADTRDAAFWLDSSGNDNDFQHINLDHNDTVSDSPTDNFATLNPLDSNSNDTLSDGNLKIVTSSSAVGKTRATIGVSSGKWYWEVTCNAATANAQFMIGITTQDSSLTTYFGGSNGDYTYYGNDGYKYYDGGSNVSYGATYGVGDVIGVALDMNAGTLIFYKNGVSQGTAFTGLSGEYFPALGDGSGSNGYTMTINFGQQPFKYDPPA